MLPAEVSPEKIIIQFIDRTEERSINILVIRLPVDGGM